jgi:hypothetical protein
LYAYADGDPVNLVDPEGLEIQCKCRVKPPRIVPKGHKDAAPTPGETRAPWSSTFQHCKQRADGSWGYDAKLNVTIQQQYWSEAVKTAPSKESPGLKLFEHEDLHQSDYQKNACNNAPVNTALPTEGFNSKAACEQDRKSFGKRMHKFMDDVGKQSTRLRDVEGNTTP